MLEVKEERTTKISKLSGYGVSGNSTNKKGKTTNLEGIYARSQNKLGLIEVLENKL